MRVAKGLMHNFIMPDEGKKSMVCEKYLKHKRDL